MVVPLIAWGNTCFGSVLVMDVRRMESLMNSSFDIVIEKGKKYILCIYIYGLQSIPIPKNRLALTSQADAQGAWIVSSRAITSSMISCKPVW